MCGCVSYRPCTGLPKSPKLLVKVIDATPGLPPRLAVTSFWRGHWLSYCCQKQGPSLNPRERGRSPG
ncbi:hypothetical protein ILYODFUR_016167 [Ilyodon furcidens]|uniref:Uncharacterized protein n=1 Tax=Ilyodon furcidens TaxID=33524 RepID=A0ABV0UGH8_9TELE